MNKHVYVMFNHNTTRDVYHGLSLAL